MKFHLLSLACAASLALPAAAQSVVLDSYGPGDATDGWFFWIKNNETGRQDGAIPFSLGSATSIESILSSLDGVGGVTFGVMARNGAVPAGNTWLYSTHLVDPLANTAITPSGWALPAGDYWLAAVADPGFDGSWKSGTSDFTVPWAYTSNAGIWQATTSTLEGLPAARITVTSAVPEPGSYALMLAGMGLLAFAARRKGGAA